MRARLTILELRLRRRRGCRGRRTREFFIGAVGVEFEGGGFEDAGIGEDFFVVVFVGEPFPEKLGGAVGIDIDAAADEFEEAFGADALAGAVSEVLVHDAEAAVAAHELAHDVPGEGAGSFEGFGEVVDDPDFAGGGFGGFGGDDFFESFDLHLAAVLGVAGDIGVPRTARDWSKDEFSAEQAPLDIDGEAEIFFDVEGDVGQLGDLVVAEAGGVGIEGGCEVSSVRVAVTKSFLPR